MGRIPAWSLVAMLLACGASSDDDDAPNTTIAVSESGSESEAESGTGPDSDSDSDSDPGPQGNCAYDDHELVGTLEVTTFRLGGQNLAFDPAAGGVACLRFRDDDTFRMTLEFGPKSGADHESRLGFEADIAPRSYDLATEAGKAPGQVWIVYSRTVGAGTWQNDPQSSPVVGTIDVVATAFDDPTFDVSAVGQIGPDDGWVFDMRFVGEWADD